MDQASFEELTPLTPELKDYYFGSTPLTIALSGRAGAGKTLFVSNCKSLGVECFESGYRLLVESMDRISLLAETDPLIDFELDALAIRRVKDHEATPTPIIGSGRVVPFFDSPSVASKINSAIGTNLTPAKINIKLMLTVDYAVGGKRHFDDPVRRLTEKYADLNEAVTKDQARDRQFAEHVKQIYGIQDIYDQEKFDIVIDTTDKAPSQVIALALSEIRRVRLAKQ